MISLLLALFGGFIVLSAISLAGRAFAPQSPPSLSFGLGAVVLSNAIFALMLTHHASLRALSGVLAVAIVAGLVRQRPRRLTIRRPATIWLVAFVPFGVWYAVNALAPEVQADPNTYHLLPAVDSLRLGGFSPRITFYEQLPHAFELLLVPAWRIGGSSAAKLVHFGFLLATLPVIVRLARLWTLRDDVAYGAAALYFCTPVVGFAGTAAFNDAALVYFTLAAVAYAAEDRPWHAGLLAGFCYAVKMTGLLAVPVALAFFLRRKHWKQGAYVAIAAALVCLPWLLRNALQTGNPFAPFLNALFPNPYFYAWTEQNLTRNLRDYGVPLWQRIPELLIGSRLHGILGPAFALAPIALLVVRKHNGIVVLLLAAVFSVPWWMNAGARFTMTMLPFLAIAMCAAIPRRAIIALVSLHAVTAWPTAIELYSPNALRVHSLPWRAAIRMETEQVYLARTSYDYGYVRMIERATPPNARIFDLWGAHAVHSTRELVSSWQSSEGVRLLDALEFARAGGTSPLVLSEANFEPQPVCGIRVVLQQDTPQPWAIHGVAVRHKARPITPEGDRFVTAAKLPWDVPLAFDSNPVSRWWTGQNARKGDFVRVEYATPATADCVRVLLPANPPPPSIAIEVCRDGRWMSVPTNATAAPELNLKPAAIGMLKRAGITHILTPVAFEGIGAFGERLVNTADDWGLEVVDHSHAVYLLRVR